MLPSETVVSLDWKLRAAGVPDVGKVRLVEAGRGGGEGRRELAAAGRAQKVASEPLPNPAGDSVPRPVSASEPLSVLMGRARRAWEHRCDGEQVPLA